MKANFHPGQRRRPGFGPKQGLDEGVDLDSLIPALRAVLIVRAPDVFGKEP